MAWRREGMMEGIDLEGRSQDVEMNRAGSPG
jgi:hypothetical protein